MTDAELLAEIERLDALIGDATSDVEALSMDGVKAKVALSKLSFSNRRRLLSALRGVEAARERPHAVLAWAAEMFGPVAMDADERTFRFLEEAIELAQARGIQLADIHAIAGRTYSRPSGAVPREIGQCQLTLEALAAQAGCDAHHEAKYEFDRVREIPREEWARRHAVKAALGITKDAALSEKVTP